MFRFLLMCVIFQSLVASIIDYSSTKMITSKDRDSYFGYSILLQKGNPPVAIVGAPRQKFEDKSTGAVFRCNLNNLNCEEYDWLSQINANLGIYVANRTGNFLGSDLDGSNDKGGKFFTCAPRFITTAQYYLKGRCFKIPFSQNLSQEGVVILPVQKYGDVSQIGRMTYFDAGYAESGFDIIYRKDLDILLVGAPGKSSYNGALLAVTNSNYFYRSAGIPFYIDLFAPQFDYSYHNSLFGYAVAWGKFIVNSNRTWYVAGGPRAENFKGVVLFFDEFGRNITTKLVGEDYGSYFGSSLLVVHHSDGDDILVGAPTYSGETYDEGCVHYYKNSLAGGFNAPVKLTSKKVASRFGTLISDAGDIDLDSFPDCAISAPYEDDGVGAVYIYFGTKDGFTNDNFHKISPEKFPVAYSKVAVKGFGLGVARAVDITGDKHNDLAIGAYRSGQVFFFKSQQIVDVQTRMTSNLNAIFTSTRNFTISVCLKITTRNGAFLEQLYATELLVLDDRVQNGKRRPCIIATSSGNWTCKYHDVLVKSNHYNMDPFVVQYRYSLVHDEMPPNDFTKEVLTLPVSYACGTDNICHTKLTIEAAPLDTSEVVFGLATDLKIKVVIKNSGESAYHTRVRVQLPPEISLMNVRECDLVNGSYDCFVANEVTEEVQKIFFLDLDSIQATNLTVYFSVTSLGLDTDEADNTANVTIPVVLRSNPDFFSQSEPELLLLNKTKSSIGVVHRFVLGNQGPSPFDLDLTILVPSLSIGDKDLVQVESVEGSVNGIVTECKYINTPTKGTSLGKFVPTNHLICGQNGTTCTNITCSVGLFYKSTINAVFTMKFNLDVPVLLKLSEREDCDEDKLNISSAAYFSNGTKEFRAIATTVIYGVVDSSSIPLWIFLVSGVLGVVLLTVLILVLYKCNFFTRTYKEKLEDEQHGREAVVEESISDEL